MKTKGSPRRDVICSLCPPGRVVVDVGADHGHVALRLGAIASEKAPHLVQPRPGLRWVVADGLRPYRHVDVAVVAGMGARTIARVLVEGARPRVAVLHAQDDPPLLRRWLATHGWRIDAERLAPEGRGFAEVVRVVQGAETATGLELEYGPILQRDGDPCLAEHLEHLIRARRRIATDTRGHAPEAHERAMRHVVFLERWKSRL